MSDLLDAHQYSINNRSTVEASRLCGCFYCLHLFSPADIVAWTGLDLSKFDDPNATADTALCPRCGSESVIGDRSGHAINVNFLSQMHEAWFERTIIQRPSTKK